VGDVGLVDCAELTHPSLPIENNHNMLFSSGSHAVIRGIIDAVETIVKERRANAE